MSSQVGNMKTGGRSVVEMVDVPAGAFLMGSNARADEKPQRELHLPSYRIARTLITNAQFDEFVRSNGYMTLAEKEEWSYTFTGTVWGEIKGADWKHPEGPESSIDDRLDHPVLNVSWFDATNFCEWLTRQEGGRYRLPTEAEWEKAARGGLLLADGARNPVPDRQYPWGNQPPDSTLCNFGWHVGGRTRVGSYSPRGDSPYGCQDMAGNVWEWCLSIYRPYPYASNDGREQLTGDANRSVRGGSWHEDKWVARVPGRGRTSPYFRDCYLGFRPVRFD